MRDMLRTEAGREKKDRVVRFVAGNLERELGMVKEVVELAGRVLGSGIEGRSTSMHADNVNGALSA